MNKVVTIFFLVFLLTPVLYGQQDKDPGIQKKIAFADYLFNTRQYEFAAEEYLKLIYSHPDNPYLKQKALESFRLNNNLESGIYFSKKFFDSPDSSSIKFYPEIVKLRLSARLPVLAPGIMVDSIKFEKWYHESLLLDYMMSEQWDEVHKNANKIKYSDLFQFTRNTPDNYYLSPFLAGTMSAIIPGSGKFYARRWKDGISSLLFVGLTAFQSYRGFEKNGVESVYGWIMGGLSFSFYLGNVYGSVKAAKDYNQNLNEKYKENIIDFYMDHY